MLINMTWPQISFLHYFLGMKVVLSAVNFDFYEV